MKLKTYEIECDLCEELTKVVLISETETEPDYCPCCGAFVGCVFIDAEADSDD